MCWPCPGWAAQTVSLDGRSRTESADCRTLSGKFETSSVAPKKRKHKGEFPKPVSKEQEISKFIIAKRIKAREKRDKCKCGSTTHLNVSSKDCSCNKKNIDQQKNEDKAQSVQKGNLWM